MKINDKLIEQLFFGNITPNNSYTYKTENYVSASKQNGELYELFIKTLDEKQVELLQELLETRAAMNDEEILGAFKDGFKLGMGLAIEGLSSNFVDDD